MDEEPKPELDPEGYRGGGFAAQSEKQKVERRTGWDASGVAALTPELRQKWAEATFLLNMKVEDEADLVMVRQRISGGCGFFERLELIAKHLGVQSGQLCQWLIPFDEATGFDQASSALAKGNTPERTSSRGHDVVAAAAGRAGFGDNEKLEMVSAAVHARSLVKVKIADNNDIEMAKDAYAQLAVCFDLISREAAKQCVADVQILRLLNQD